MDRRIQIVESVKETLIRAGSSFSYDKTDAYKRAIAKEVNPQAKWVLETILQNAAAAKKNRSPLCDDTGIPHLFIEIGKNRVLSGDMIDSIYEGIEAGLRELPGRPMAIKGNDEERISQSGGLDIDSGALEPAPLLIKKVDEDVLRLHIIMQGGGPAIRGKTYRVFHRHKLETVIDEIVSWASEAVSDLGCTPCTLAVGIGRSQYEASALMMESQVYGNYARQNAIEKEITDRVNNTGVGVLGLGGTNSVLATFVKVGPQRASGVRIVCLRPCCCFEPRIASVEL